MENTEILGSYVQPDRPLPAREYKDRLFKAVFGRDTEQSRHWRLDLYNALNGTGHKHRLEPQSGASKKVPVVV